MTSQSFDPGLLSAIVNQFRAVRLLCVGDVMLDRYVYGSVDRVSPEAPIPVMCVRRREAMLGGAGNVVRNAAALGAQTCLIAPVGDDPEARDIEALIEGERGLSSRLIALSGRRTTVKTRFVAGSQQLLRADEEETGELAAADEERLIDAATEELAASDVLVLSDYAKGCLSERVLTALIGAARAAEVPVIVDPKSLDFTRYAGVTLIKPNARELAAATSLPCDSDEEITAAGVAALGAAGAERLLVTRSSRGMTLIGPDGEVQHFPAEAQEVFDVSGAGDTALAALGLALAAKAGYPDAVRLANMAASLVVAKVGTAVISNADLLSKIHAQELTTSEAKIQEVQSARETIERWRARGLRIGFTNGCFDLIHPGHVSLLRQARAACDRLVVGLNTDDSIKRLKGPERPIQPEMARAVVLASMADVDMVVLFAEDTPLALIEAFKPDVLVKGADYTVETVVGSDIVLSYGGEVVLARLEDGYSTTGTIARISA